MVRFVNLPGDVVFLIIDQLRRERDIDALCRTSRDVYRLVNPYLYRRQTRGLICSVLTWAALHDRVGTANKLLAEGANPFTGIAALRSLPPITVAAKYGSVEVTKLLFRTECGDPEWNARVGSTSIFCAASRGHEEVLKLYLANPRVDPARKDKFGRTPLWGAATKRQPRTVELLLRDKRIDPSVGDWEGRTPLMDAADDRQDNTDVMRLLLGDCRVDVNCTDRSGLTALHAACNCGNAAHARLLLDAGADIDAPRGYLNDTSPLIAGAWGAEPAVLERLLAAPGVDPNVTNWEGRTVLMIVADLCHKIWDNSTVFRLLSDERVLPNIMDHEGMTALSISASHGNYENMGRLLARDDIDVNLGTKQQQFVLHHAIKSRDETIVKELLDDDRLDVLSKDEAGWTPLLLAVARAPHGIIRLLLESGRCSLDDRVEGRGHAWSLAVERDNNDVMALLVEFRDEFSRDTEVPEDFDPGILF